MKWKKGWLMSDAASSAIRKREGIPLRLQRRRERKRAERLLSSAVAVSMETELI